MHPLAITASESQGYLLRSFRGVDTGDDRLAVPSAIPRAAAGAHRAISVGATPKKSAPPKRGHFSDRSVVSPLLHLVVIKPSGQQQE
jgi:hypothetical protein